MKCFSVFHFWNAKIFLILILTQKVFNNIVISVCNLNFINFVHGVCEIALAIGEKEFRKGSYGFECFTLLLKIAFLKLNLRIIKSNYIESNEYTKNIQKVLRFKEIGKIKDWFWINGKYEDLIIEVLHRDEWLKRNKYI